jgi:hypothetical protein
MLRLIARDGDAILLADGDLGALVLPDGQFQVALVGSLQSQGDWEDASGPTPDYVPVDRIAIDMDALKRRTP